MSSEDNTGEDDGSKVLALHGVLPFSLMPSPQQEAGEEYDASSQLLPDLEHNGLNTNQEAGSSAGSFQYRPQHHSYRLLTAAFVEVKKGGGVWLVCMCDHTPERAGACLCAALSHIVFSYVMPCLLSLQVTESNAF